jgi:hypothetical protein
MVSDSRGKVHILTATFWSAMYFPPTSYNPMELPSNIPLSWSTSFKTKDTTLYNLHGSFHPYPYQHSQPCGRQVIWTSTGDEIKASLCEALQADGLTVCLFARISETVSTVENMLGECNMLPQGAEWRASESVTVTCAYTLRQVADGVVPGGLDRASRALIVMTEGTVTDRASFLQS